MRDPVTPELRQHVLRRDGGCVAPRLDPDAGRCYGRLTLDHIRDQPMMGKRAPSDPAHLATVCEAHSEGGMRAGMQWNTAHRAMLREYLRRVTA